MKRTKAIKEETSRLEQLVANRNLRNQNVENSPSDYTSEVREIRQSVEQILPWVDRELKSIKEQLNNRANDEQANRKIFSKIEKLNSDFEIILKQEDEKYEDMKKELNLLKSSSAKMNVTLSTIQEEILNFEDEDNSALLNTVQNQKKEINSLKSSISSLESYNIENSRKSIENENYINCIKKELNSIKFLIEQIRSEETVDIAPLKRDVASLKNNFNVFSEQIKNEESRLDFDISKREIQTLKNQNTVISENLRISVNDLTNSILQTEENFKNLLSKELKTFRKENLENLENFENKLEEKLAEIKTKSEKTVKDGLKNSEEQNNKNSTEIQILKSELKSLSNLIERSRLSEKNIESRVSELLTEYNFQNSNNDLKTELSKEIREIKRLLSGLTEEKNIIIRRLEEISTHENKKQEFNPIFSELKIEENENTLRIEETKRQLKDLIDNRTKALEAQIKDNNNKNQIEKIESKILRHTQQLEELVSDNEYENLRVRIQYLERQFIDQPSEHSESKECDREHPREQFKKLQKEVRELTCRFNNIENLEKKIKKIECELAEICHKMITKCELEKIIKVLTSEFDEKLREINERISLLDSELNDKINFLIRETENNKKLILLLDQNLKELAKSTAEKFSDVYSKLNVINNSLVSLREDVRDIRCQLEKVFNELSEQQGQINILDKKIEHNFIVLKRAIDDSIKRQEAFEILINTRIENINDKINDQNEKFIVIERAVENQNLKIIELTKRLTELEKVVSDLNIIEINSEIESIKKDIFRIDLKNERQDEEISELNRKVESLEIKVTAIMQSISRTDKKLEKIEKQLDRFQDLSIEEFKAIHEQLNDIDLVLKDFRKEYDINKQEIIAKFLIVDRKILENEEKVNKVISDLVSTDEKLAILSAKFLKEQEQNLAKFLILDTKLDKLSKELDHIEKELCHLKKQTAENTKNICELDGKVESISHSLCVVDKELKDLRVLTYKNVEELLKLKIAFDESEKQILILKGLIENNTEEILKIKILTDENTENIIKLNALLEIYKNELDDLKDLTNENVQELLRLKILIETNSEKIDKLKLIVDLNSEEILKLKLLLDLNSEELEKLKLIVKVNSDEIKDIKKQLQCFSEYIDDQEKFKRNVLCRLEALERNCNPCSDVNVNINTKCGENSVLIKNHENDVELSIYPGLDASGPKAKIDRKWISFFSNSSSAKFYFKNKVLTHELQTTTLKTENLETTKINGKNVSECLMSKNYIEIAVTANHEFTVTTGGKITGLNVFLSDWLVPAGYDTYIWRQFGDDKIKIKTGNTIGSINGLPVTNGNYMIKWF